MRSPLLTGIGMLAAAGFMSLPRGLAQSPPAASFEVASIRPTVNPGAVRLLISGPRVTLTAYALLGLLRTAYEVEPDQILGGPNWMESDRFDIAAKAEGEATPTKAEVGLMLQSLLAGRFQLRMHRENKEMSVYKLVVGKGGPKLKLSTSDEQSSFRLGSSLSLTELTVTRGTIEQLALQLPRSGVDRPVLDATGLSGSFDYKLSWSPDIPDAATSDPGGPPSLFTAIQEQLGLKLESDKRPVNVLVIDHVEKPSKN